MPILPAKVKNKMNFKELYEGAEPVMPGAPGEGDVSANDPGVLSTLLLRH